MATSTKDYRPSDDEPFMGPRQKAYFRAKLQSWREEIIKQTRETLERNEVNRLLGSIIEQRKREAKVQYDKPLLEQFGMLGDEAKGT